MRPHHLTVYSLACSRYQESCRRAKYRQTHPDRDACEMRPSHASGRRRQRSGMPRTREAEASAPPGPSAPDSPPSVRAIFAGPVAAAAAAARGPGPPAPARAGGDHRRALARGARAAQVHREPTAPDAAGPLPPRPCHGRPAGRTTAGLARSRHVTILADRSAREAGDPARVADDSERIMRALAARASRCQTRVAASDGPGGPVLKKERYRRKN